LDYPNTPIFTFHFCYFSLMKRLSKTFSESFWHIILVASMFEVSSKEDMTGWKWSNFMGTLCA
jgi:hypothetical protein